MGKPTIKKKNKKKKDSSNNKTTIDSSHSKHNDKDAAISIEMSHDMKEEGNGLFQRRDYDGAASIYEKAIKILPKDHIDVAYLRSNLAACYMHMTPPDYRRAINQCNLALEVSPVHTKSLLKRARCLEALNRFESACKDVDSVLALEPNNLTALEISERIKSEMEKKGIALDDKEMVSPPKAPILKEKNKKKKGSGGQKVEDKVVVEVKGESFKKEEPTRIVKLVFGKDIRCAQLPAGYSVTQLREAIRSRFPSLKAVLAKYKDEEGDLVTVTTSEELRRAEESAGPHASLRLYLVEIEPEHEPMFEEGRRELEIRGPDRNLSSFSDNGSMRHCDDDGTSACIGSWIIQFAQMFKNHVGFNSDEYLELHELGMKLYSEAMEDAVTSEDAQEIFTSAEEKFQEMTALALFNWGNVHMSRARKRLFSSEDGSDESTQAQVSSAFEWAHAEYIKAGKKYEEALQIKPDFYEGFLALGQQLYEQAKLSWYYATGSGEDLDTWLSTEVLELFNNAEDNMERGTEIWEKMEAQRLKNLSRHNRERRLLEKMSSNGSIKSSNGSIKDMSNDEAAEKSSNMRSQINLLWGAMLYKRSVVEFKLDLPDWEECLMAAIEKFKQAGTSTTDIAVMIKNHVANETTQEALGFKIDEIVQAWNEMYDAKRWIRGVPSFRLEPLFRRRAPKLHYALEHVCYSMESSTPGCQV